MQGIEIIFIKVPYENVLDKDVLFESYSTDVLLNRIAEDHVEELKTQQIETFDRKGNILTTEEGYIVILYKDEQLAKQIRLEQKQMLMN